MIDRLPARRSPSRWIAGSAALAATLVVAACGSSDEKKDSTEAAKDDKGQTTVRSRSFDTDIPGSWQIKNRPATRSAVIGTWKRSIDPDSTLVIAVTGKERTTAEESLGKLRQSLQANPDFQEIAFDRVDLGKQAKATRFAFKVGDNQKVFFLFDACGNKTVSLVGTAPTQKFAEVEKSFEETANGFDPNCDGTLEAPQDPAAVDRALETLATSPSGDFDDVADELGVNDPAQQDPANEIKSTEPDAQAAEGDEQGTGPDEEGVGTDEESIGTDDEQGVEEDGGTGAGEEPGAGEDGGAAPEESEEDPGQP